MPVSAPPVDKELKKTGPVGQSLPRADGREKVCGEPLYYGDFNLPNMLHARVLRSRYPHARILRVDTSRACALPGVAAVLTANDIPGAKAIGRAKDWSILCEHKVTYLGDGVALVAAESLEVAARALDLIDVEYQVLPAVFSPREAMQPGAPLVHEDNERHDNVLRHFKLRKGDVEAAFRSCDVIIENTYQTPTGAAAYLEAEGAIASKGADGAITVWAAAQIPFMVRDNVAAMLRLPTEKVRLINTNAGGAFGGKGADEASDCACRAALLSYVTGRPVKLVYGMEESLKYSTKRHAAIIEYKTGATRDGRLQAVEARIYLNKGAYSSVGGHRPPASGLTNKAGYHAAGPYVVPNVRVDVYNVYTNNPAGGAVRGFGVPQVNFAYEQQMDELARSLGMDPVEIRLLNGLEAGCRTSSDQLLESSVGLKSTIRQAMETARWRKFRAERDQSKNEIWRRGIGISSFNFACTPGVWPEFGNATMEVDATGRIVVRGGISELGQGSRTVLAQIAAQALQMPIEQVVVSKVGDTATDQDSLQTTSSRGTINAGNAIIRAAAEARQTLLEMAAELLERQASELVQNDDGFRQIDGPAAVSYQEVLLYCYKCGRRLIGKGWWCVPKAKVDQETGLGNPYHIFAYGTQIIEVAVNIRTGEIAVKRVVAAQDVGKAINPTLVKGQMQGGVVMGLGFALSEEIVLHQGSVVNPSCSTFILPTAADIPEIVPILVEDEYPAGPFGAKGVGEPGAVATAAAVANAVYDAVGVRIRQLPITAERVWKALQNAQVR